MLGFRQFLRLKPTLLTLASDLATGVSHTHRFPAYVKLHFHEVKAGNPDLKAPDVLKKLSQMYKAIPAAELEKLNLEIVADQNPKSESEKLEQRKKILFARKHGLPKSPPITAYQVYIMEQLSGNKGTPINAMALKFVETSKAWNLLSQQSKEKYIVQAMENKLTFLRALKQWAEEKEIQFSKRISVLSNRLFAKHQRIEAKRLKESKAAPRT
uniref:HMG box domain-containing protein n=1 Tax=Schistocephalus solidus TaxID=70667 RepID=A0A0X3PI64_SCHSO